MPSTLELLAMPQEQAFRTMVEAELISNVTMDDISIGDGFLQSGNRSSALIESSTSRLADNEWPYRGTAIFSHRRIALETFFQGIDLRLKVPATESGGVNTTSNVIAGMLEDIFNIHFHPQDYYSDEIIANGMTEYIFRATPMSLRWTGAVRIKVYPDLEGVVP